MMRSLPRPGVAAGGSLACILVLARLAGAAPSGVLDPSFGSAGKVVTAIGGGDDFGNAAAIQADGRVLVAGYSTTTTTSDDMSVARFDDTGVLDPTFAGTGKAIVGHGNDADRALAVAVSPVDQKIVLAGFVRTAGKDDVAIVRLQANGTLDGGFAAGGKATVSLAPGDDAATAVAVQSDGKVVAAGWALGTNRDVAVTRLTTGGALDTTFAGTGKLVFPVGTGNDEAAAIAIQPDGRILVAGSAADGSQADMLVARLTPGGTLDPTFGPDGKVRIAFGTGNEFATGLALQPDGRILVGGYARVGTAWNFAVARLTASGALDPTFDGDGLVTTAIGSSSKAWAVGFGDGHVLLAGSAQVGGNDDFALARYGVDGALDVHFGGGAVTAAFGSGADVARGVVVQSDRRIVVAGSARSLNDDNFALARWLVDDCGNGRLDEGEECDGSALANGYCCSACRVSAEGTSCRGVADRCDLPEACDGTSGDCPADAGKPDADGDLVCDEFDVCPDEPDPEQADGDSDGLGDACDPCTNGPAATRAKLKISNYATAAGDDKFTLDGTIRFAGPVDLRPDLQGMRVLLHDRDGLLLADTTVPPGTGWTPNRAGTAWSWRSSSLVGGWVNTARLRTVSGRLDTVSFAVGGSRGAFAISRPALPLGAIVVVDAPTAATGLCGFVAFSETGPPAPSCRTSPTGGTVECK